MYEILEPLLQQTPSSQQKLLEAWDNLDDMAAIYVISTLIERIKELPLPFIQEAIKHNNPYIRYLVASNFRGSSYYFDTNEYSNEDIVAKKIHEQLVQDNSKLVKAAINNPNGKYFTFSLKENWIERFFALDQTTRLECIAHGIGMSISAFSDILETAIKENFNLQELLELSEEFVASSTIKNYYEEWHNSPELRNDCMQFYYHRDELKRLWKIVLEFSGDVGYILANKLPLDPESPRYASALPSHESLIKNVHVLYALLNRADFSERELRQRILFSDEYDYFKVLRNSAVLFISFTDKEFYDCIKQRSDRLALISNSSNLTLAQYCFIENAIEDSNFSFHTLNENKSLHLKKLPQYQLKAEIDDLLKFEFIVAMSNNKERFEDDFRNDADIYNIIIECLKKDDTWEAYMFFKQAYNSLPHSKSKKLNFNDYISLEDDILELIENEDKKDIDDSAVLIENQETENDSPDNKQTEKLKELNERISTMQSKHNEWLIIIICMLIAIIFKLFK